MKDDENRMADVAVAAAKAAGEILEQHARRRQKVHHYGDHDLKIEADRLCERAILDTILGAFPDHAVLTEEGGRSGPAGAYQWIIDPLDGTVNYFYGLPYYCTSIACFETSGKAPAAGGIGSLGRPVAGVVYAPRTGDLFVGRAGKGAVLNGEAIRTGEVQTLGDAIICMGFGKSDELGRHMAEASSLLADRVRKLRCFGAAAYDLAHVACGRLSAFFEKGLRTWDIAAGYVILKEAGGSLDARELAPTRWRLLASAPGIFRELESTLRGV